ncbi:uncharacterized protein LOC121492606 [Vulpes lagopus]|uniref:uncharacterized protein LOC121492606 n=1 Tax=Vulpes lagopus TaxID=494514 RepID=UPI001BC9EB40|nr:uncharacterized protein LOC121492606 [Vulpes lagopus]
MQISAFRNSAFCRCSGTCQNNQCTAAPSAKPGQLFGISLMDICDKDNLPFPILVGLSLVFYCLSEEGDLGEAKCSHAKLPPNGEIIGQPRAVAEKLWNSNLYWVCIGLGGRGGPWTGGLEETSLAWRTESSSVRRTESSSPTWDDCRQLLKVFFTTEEGERIQVEARKSVLGEDRQPTQNPDLINAAFPLSLPTWDYNSAEDTFPGWTEAFPTKHETAQIMTKKLLEDISLVFLLRLDQWPRILL